MTTNKFSMLKAGSASLALGLALVATPGFAQTSPVSDPAASKATSSDTGTEEIVVTGSRIARRDLDTAAPLAVVSAEEFKQSGQVNVEQVLNTLPQVIPGTTSFSNNPGGGVATLNLRNLGSTRSLVLVNGKRYMFFDTTQRVDLNTIPTFLLGGVDVVTGGASAVYGSDAIAGVVNFRLRNDLQGVEVGSQYNLTQKGDGQRFDTHVAMGTAFADGRGHITAYAEYYKRKPVFQSQRTNTQVALADGAAGLVPGGSASTPKGRFSAIGTANGLGTNFTGLGATFDTPGGASRPYVGATDAYNYAPSNYLMVPEERWLMGAYGDYEANEHLTAYTELSFVNNRVDSSLAASPFTGNYLFPLATQGQYLNAADRATLTAISARQVAAGTTFTGADGVLRTVQAGQVGLNLARRSIEVGLRQNHDDRNAYRVLGGLKGDIVSGWTYDAYYSYSRTRNASVQSGNLSQRAVQAGILSGVVDLFGPGSLSPAAVNAITISAQNSDISVLQVANASVSGSLFNLGMGGDDVAVAFGGEYRSMSSQFIPDTALSSGDVVGFSAAKPTQGGYNVKEAFAELNVPIAADQPFIKTLEFNAAGRYSKYSLGNVGGVYTYALGGKYAPIKDITFRGQYSRAVRAPNVNELFGGAGQDSAQAQDPCAAATARTNATLNALCVATGVPAALVGTGLVLAPNPQIGGITGGNPNLEEERSTSYTYGVVLRPTFVPRFNLSADYFNINIKNAISAGGGGVANILNLCYNTIQNASSSICQLIKRNPTNGVIDGTTSAAGQTFAVFETQANLGFIKTSGVDIAADYTQPLNWGIGAEESRLNLSAAATYTKTNDIQAIAGLTTVKCAGRFGLTCGDPQPKWKISGRATFQNGPVTTSLKWTRLGAVRDDDPATTYFVERIGSYNLFDLSASIDVSDAYSFSVGVNNLANKKPTNLGSNQQQSNTYPGTYDVLGRDFFVSANLRF